MDSKTTEVTFVGRPETSPATKLIFFSLLILTLPITVYFASKALLFEALFGMSSGTSYFYAAISAIFTVHVVLALFIYVAWSEGSKPEAKVH